MIVNEINSCGPYVEKHFSLQSHASVVCQWWQLAAWDVNVSLRTQIKHHWQQLSMLLFLTNYCPFSEKPHKELVGITATERQVTGLKMFRWHITFMFVSLSKWDPTWKITCRDYLVKLSCVLQVHIYRGSLKFSQFDSDFFSFSLFSVCICK